MPAKLLRRGVVLAECSSEGLCRPQHLKGAGGVRGFPEAACRCYVTSQSVGSDLCRLVYPRLPACKTALSIPQTRCGSCVLLQLQILLEGGLWVAICLLFLCLSVVSHAVRPSQALFPCMKT